MAATSQSGYVLALDEGSTSARSVLVDGEGAIVSEARSEITWDHPRPGWVEMDPMALWRSQLDTIHRAVAGAGATAKDLAAVAVTSHRETIAIWDRATGEPVHPFLVWISQQTDGIVNRWRAQGLDADIRKRTGLRNDSFFSAAKLAWLLENVPDVRRRAEAGELACGTVDTWLLWQLTGGRSHLTDHSCASRTALFNLDRVEWDGELCDRLGVPMSLFPQAVPSDSDFGMTDPDVIGAAVPIRAVMADQQAGMYGQACFGPGAAKNTFGTAGVLTLNSGQTPQLVDGLTSSVAWTVGGRTDYELEGVVFHSGQTLQWLRDNLGLWDVGTDVEHLAESVPDSGGVTIVPAFGGMCAPHWDRDARAAIVGLSLGSNTAHVARAAIESMAFQTGDILTVLTDAGLPIPELKVDGGAARNNLLCQFLSDITGLVVRRPHALERTALGVAFVAGTAVGMFDGAADVERTWTCEREFTPQLSADERATRWAGWHDAVDRTLPSRTPGRHPAPDQPQVPSHPREVSP